MLPTCSLLTCIYQFWLNYCRFPILVLFPFLDIVEAELPCIGFIRCASLIGHCTNQEMRSCLFSKKDAVMPNAGYNCKISWRPCMFLFIIFNWMHPSFVCSMTSMLAWLNYPCFYANIFVKFHDSMYVSTHNIILRLNFSFLVPSVIVWIEN